MLKFYSAFIHNSHILQLQFIDLSPPVDPASVGTQLISALVVGLLTAFAFQLLLTSFGVAAGITAVGFQFRGAIRSRQDDLEAGDEAALDRPDELPNQTNVISTIGFAAGLGVLLTVNSALSGASFLAAKFSVVSSPMSGAIVGIVIWSAYFLILTWISSTAISSLIGLILSSATSGFRKIISVIGTALNRDEASADLLTKEAALAAIRQEVQAALNTTNFQHIWEEYLEAMPSPQPDTSAVRQEIISVLNMLEPDAKAALSQVDRQAFVELIHQRTHLPLDQAEQIVADLESNWQEAIDRHPQHDLNAELLQFLKSANPELLKFDQLNAQLEQLLNSQPDEPNSTSWRTRLQQVDFGAVKRAVLHRLDLSDIDVEEIWQQLQSLRHQIISNPDEDSQSNSSEERSFNPIREDIEDYLQYTEPSHLLSDGLATEFKQVIYDSEAAPELVRSHLEQIDPADFGIVLAQRDDLDAEQQTHVRQELKSIWQDVLDAVAAAEIEQQQHYLRQQLETYVQTAKKNDLDLDTIQASVQANVLPVLQGAGIGATVLSQIWSQFDRQTFEEWLHQRDDLTKKETKQLAKRLAKMGDGLVATVRDRADSIPTTTETTETTETLEAQSSELWQKLESYLRYTHVKRLTPAKAERKLQKLIHDLQATAKSAQVSFSEFDQAALVDVLQRRQGLSKKQIQQIVDQLEDRWNTVIQASQASLHRAKVQVEPVFDDVTSKVADYLEQLDWSPDSLEELQQYLLRLLSLSTAGTWLLRQQLADLDWDALGDRLRQKTQFDDDQIRRLIAQIKTVVHRAIKAPRRWALRSPSTSSTAVPNPTVAGSQSEPDRSRVDQLLSKMGDALNGLDFSELSYTSIKYDLQQLLNDSPLGFDSLNQSLKSVFDFSTDAVGGSLDALRDSLTATLRDRLIQFNQSILASVLQSRTNLSDTVRQQVTNQVEGVRDRMLAQVEQVQQGIQARVEAIKLDAQQRAEATRRAAATAAWWLFATAMTSAVTSAIAGTVAVSGIHLDYWTNLFARLTH
ncbi:hypothetical protein IQ268_15275 [Oculatella sp. LEGE 06141]|uniref:hypothetical protein n=1 Tax=Oculatella sp. LEGE 06141 TaxID=1828648 RepID=UPI00188111DF|nr:hypothetical protein [Oculatella sp. LEGE 06141]MBE9179932.1 hypothetical protein [Oculatella sp. LEGE 06141]